MLITFACEPSNVDGVLVENYAAMFKAGDDLRQDQLVIQLLTLMDMLLKRENLDLKLTPYKVLATGVDQGLVQFVPSQPLADILSAYTYEGGLLGFLRKHNPDPESIATYGIQPNVMDTYLRSCGKCLYFQSLYI